MARKLDAAFTGCEHWDSAPPRRRRAQPPQSSGLAGPLALAQSENYLLGQARPQI
ncbi:MAG: hypothetical protein ACR2OC_00850 [Solirubrobacterales bacterium]